MINSDNKYTKMQLNYYNNDASQWSLHNKNPVVGSYDAHNNWEDYNILFENVKNKENKTVLDFACGPGRNIVKYSNIFKRVDGVDISPVNIEKAKLNLEHNNIKKK
jgi:2-polyprenyl-3-methyl-5-hydroxy-6-metoxy-1,4-benzoquinol methylase